MKRDRLFWYEFFSDLGFLVMPCGFNWHSTTQWLFKDTAEESYLSNDDFKIRLSGIHCFFYNLDDQVLQQYLPLMRFTEHLVRQRLTSRGIELNVPDHYPDVFLTTIRPYDNKPYLNGFSLDQHLFLWSVITNEIDPMDWVKERVTPEYLSDFDAYGLCYLSIEKRVQA